MAGVKGKGGKKGRSGRKSKAEEFGLAALLDKCWTLEQRKEVIQTLSNAALGGDVKAAALLLAYAYGKPVERHEHEGAGGGPVVLRVIYDAGST